jgi:acyl-homoserine lactone acylase PvdQ
MQFKPGDVVTFQGGTHVLKVNPNSTRYPLRANGYSFTVDGRHTPDGDVWLTLVNSHRPPAASKPTSITHYPLGQVQTLEDGTQIYHPNDGQPFQLIPTHKGLL